MNVQAEMSLYPLRTVTLRTSIDCFLEHLRRSGLRVEIGPMSSHLAGECGDMFRTLGKAFEAAGQQSDIVVTVKVTNACPEIGGPIPHEPEVRPTPRPTANRTRGREERSRFPTRSSHGQNVLPPIPHGTRGR